MPDVEPASSTTPSALAPAPPATSSTADSIAPSGEPAHGKDAQPPPRTGVVRFTALVATVGVVAALLGVVLLARTVHTPLQDCGTVYGFLRYGRVDVLADPANPPKGVSRAEVEATNTKPCRPRVAERARPSAGLILGGVTAALLAVAGEAAARGRARRRRRRVPLGAYPTAS